METLNENDDDHPRCSTMREVPYCIPFNFFTCYIKCVLICVLQMYFGRKAFRAVFISRASKSVLSQILLLVDYSFHQCVLAL